MSNIITDKDNLEALEKLYIGGVVKIKTEVVTVDFHTLAEANEIIKIKNIELFKIDESKYKAELLINRFDYSDESIVDIQCMDINKFFRYFYEQYALI